MGTAGQWNDLSSSVTLTGYVRETNLAPTALTVSTTGNINFAKAVGNAKPFASLSITGNQVTFSSTLGIDSSGATVTTAGPSSAAGAISGAGPLVKAGSGTFVLSAANTHAGT